MHKIKNYLSLIIFLLSIQTIFSQIPCSSGYTGDGSNDFVEIPNTTYINSNNTAVSNRTIEFWFNTPDITTKQVLFEEGGGTNAIHFFVEGGRLYLGQYRDNANPAIDRRFFRTGSGNIATNTWYHVAMTLNAGATLKWYLNGEEKDSQTGFAVKKHTGDINFGRSGGNLKYPSSLVNNWTTSSVGGSTTETYNNTFTGNVNSSFYYKGFLSLFRIWNVARTASQIDTNKSIYLTSGTSLVAYQNGGTINYKGTSDVGIDSSMNTNGSGTTFTWTGASSNAYTDATNWTGAAPSIDRARTVVINSGGINLTVTSSVNVGSLTVDNGAEIIVQSGATLNVFYNLINNGIVTVENGGSLIYHSCTQAISGTGIYNIQRDTPTYPANYAYSYMSSPLIPADSNSTSVFPGQTTYYFNSSIAAPDWEFFSGNFSAGAGYAIRAESTASYQPNFSGTINTNAVSVPLFYSSTGVASEDGDNVWSTEGDNLVGNPYSSAIDWDLVISDTDNKFIDGTMYYWDQATVNVGENDVSDYKQYNLTGGASNTATGKIGTAQGFFIRATEASTLFIKPTHQIVSDNLQFFKGTNTVSLNAKPNSKKENRSWLILKRGADIFPILVGFLDKATNRYDRLYDAPFDINQKSLGFYSLIKGKDKASIQGLPTLKRDKKVVKLGYVVDQIGDYSISVTEEHIDANYFIYLRDKQEKVTVDLKQRDYAFTIDSIGENNTRFKLIYTKKKRKATQKSGKESLTVEEIDSKDFTAYINGSNELIVTYDFDIDHIEEVSLYNIQGRKTATFSGSQIKDVSNLAKGIYLVHAKLIDHRMLTKKILIEN
ncbi:LamG-like jellyroll fold domain-containing protein [uncultured Polaribacter sp.]|uniref:LamG-like jellyroll fold domain-containing protein n=1 Tax=uncultured Polaribacter sp. TaxID=174711 RepID=UPI002604E828|nr:LamG-like jellyroll fold domain-containing protein [uncultured Polaribacter sp.]